MAPLDLDTQRLLESALYGTPSYHGIRTPDGRVVTELHRLRLDEDKRHGQMTRIQGELVENLRRSNHGSTTITRSDFDSRSAELLPAFREAASRIQDLNHTQAALLSESRALGRITSQGFDAVEGQLVGVRSDLRGVSGDIVQMDAHVTGAIQEGASQVTGAIHQETRTLHGPSFPAESLTTLVNRGQLFFDALSVYSKGVLTPGAAYELEQMVNQRLRSPMAKAALKAFVDQKVEETIAKMREDEPDEEESRWTKLRRDMRKAGYELGGVIDNPSQLIGRSSNEAREKLAALEQISRVCPDEALRGFVHEAYGLISLQRKAAGASIPEAFLIDLTNSGLVIDSIQHQVKRGRREARLGGTDVDRNYNLMELLEQGDHAKTQRGKLIELSEKQVGLSEMGVAQRGVIIGQGVHAAQQRDDLIDVGIAGLAQGQRAATQRETLIDQGEKAAQQRATLVGVGIAGLAQGQKAATQREILIGQGEEVIGQQRRLVRLGTGQLLVGLASLDRLTDIDEGIRSVDGKLTQVVSSLAKTNDHLVNLELLGLGFIDAVDYGFKSVNDTLVGGFNLVAEGLDQVAIEIAVSKAAIVGQLRQMDSTIQIVGVNIVNEVAYSNQLLERLITLQLGSLQNEARQRLEDGLLRLKKAKKPEDFRRAAEVFRKGVESSSALVENQFGLASALEGMNEKNEAKGWYRDAAMLASDDKKDLAVTAWIKFARLEEEDGNFPSAIEGMRSALERDPKNTEVRFGLARLLALSGLYDEAEEIILQLIDENLQFLFRLKLNPAFSPDLLVRIYTKVWEQGGPTKKGLKVISFLIEEFASLGKKDKAISIFKHLMKGGPRLVLQYRILDSSSFPATVEVVTEYIRDIIVSDADPYAAEDWYGLTFIASRVNLPPQDVLQCFKRGLKHDMRYQKGDKDSVLAKLRAINTEYLHELIESICSVDPSFNWLNKQ